MHIRLLKISNSAVEVRRVPLTGNYRRGCLGNVRQMAGGIYAIYQYHSPRYAIVRGDILLEVATSLKEAKEICPDGTVGVEIVNIRLGGGDRRVVARQATCKFNIHELTEAELERIRERNHEARADLDLLDMFEVQEDPEESEVSSVEA